MWLFSGYLKSVVSLNSIDATVNIICSLSKEYLSNLSCVVFLLQIPFAVILDNCAMPHPSLHVIRRTNLLSLYSGFLVDSAQSSQAQPSNATDKAFSEKLAIANTSFSSYKTGARVIGDRVARQIEPLLGLPTGWMDQEHSEQTATPTEDVQLARFLKLAARAFKRSDRTTRKRLEEILHGALANRSD